ncbi:MAG: TonB-dependent receptor [Kofleriaceae bacterium]
MLGSRLPPRLRAAALTLGVALLVLTRAPAVRGQSATSGAIAGVVRDAQTGEPLAGIPIELSSTSLLGKRAAFSDERGAYKFTGLPAGRYVVTFYYDTLVVRRSGVVVSVHRTTPVFADVDTDEAPGETIEIEGLAPAIDPTSTTQGLTIDGDFLRNLPTAGRTYDAELSAAPGAQRDALGEGFSGSTSLENEYNVDGVNTTGLAVGSVGSPVLNDFIQETEIVTGGYNAEYGRSTGAVVNVATKSGSNVLRGSAFGYLTPGALAGRATRTENQGLPIDTSGKIVYDASFGAELGGPIVPDRLFFFVGFAPRLITSETARLTKSQTDCRAVDPSTGRLAPRCDPRPLGEGGLADGVPDREPETQHLIYEDLDETRLRNTSRGYAAIGKLNFATSPGHQGQVSLLADRTATRAPGVFGLRSTGRDTATLALDGAAKWTSRLLRDALELEGVLGWHRVSFDSDALDDRLNSTPSQLLLGGHLADFAGFGDETELTARRCRDGGADDRYPLIANCPLDAGAYAIGGPGLLTHTREERRSARLGVVGRWRRWGSHEVKGGLDLEQNRRSSPRLFSGGASLLNLVGEVVSVNRFVQLAPPGGAGPYLDECRSPAGDGTGDVRTLRCAFLGDRAGDFGTAVDSETVNGSLYLRDSWRPIENLTFNVGVRYEEQRLRYAAQVQNQIDPLTDRRLGTNALTLTGQWAPRLGVLYDWTRVGRSKVYLHWGRFFESIPLDINDRSFGGEVVYQQNFSPARCDPPGAEPDPRIGGHDGVGCLAREKVGDLGEVLTGASGTLIAPGVKGQYLDELVGGVEYELSKDLTLGVALQIRRLGRVIEDVSTDGAETYIVANPGELSRREEEALQAQVARTEDPALRARLLHELELFRRIRSFDRPRRDYAALTLTAQHRLVRALFLQASYTYARTRGNYPGTYASDNAQVDPNNSSQYDLIELLANRDGPLPQDRPHALKLDAYYLFELGRHGVLAVGGRFRAVSGAPISALGAHPAYGANEAFLLPRGGLGRGAMDHNLSARVSLRRALGRGISVEVFADVFNVYDRQGPTTLDQTYAPALPNNNTTPISGGSYEDLIWLKASGSGARAGLEVDEAGVPYGAAVGNPNFRNTATRAAPVATQFGMRVVF